MQHHPELLLGEILETMPEGGMSMLSGKVISFASTVAGADVSQTVGG